MEAVSYEACWCVAWCPKEQIVHGHSHAIATNLHCLTRATHISKERRCAVCSMRLSKQTDGRERFMPH